MKIQKMNKEKFKNWTIFLFFLVGSVLNSCSNFLSFDENRTDENKTSAQDDKCIITVSSDFYSNDGSRAAFPDFLLSPDTLYFAEISYTSGSSKKWLGEDSVSDTAVVLKNNYSDVIRFVFCAPQETSAYTLALYACPKQTGSQVSAVKKSAFAQGDAAFELSAGQKVLSSTLNIKLKPQESSGKGKVDLPLSFDPTLGIVAAEVNVTKDGVSDSGENNYEFKIKVSGSGARLSAENVPAGTYLAIMKFYNSMTDFSSSAEVAVNSAVQHISVYSEMTTNLWFIGGKKHGTTEADGTFTRSALELTKYDFTELYVCGKDGGGESGGKRSFYVSSNFGSSVPDASDTSGDGSMAKPFATVQKAVDTIAAFGDTSKKYTIYVDGTVTAEALISIDSNVSVKSAYSSSDYNNNALIRWSDSSASAGFNISSSSFVMDGITIDGNGKAGCGMVFAGNSLELNNCAIRKFNRGGLTVEGNITLENCSVLDNKTDGNGGGIFMRGGTLTLKNTVVNKNSAEIGGGIYMTDGTLSLESGAVIGDKLDPDVAENDISKVATDKEYGNRSTKKLTSDTGTDFDVGAGIFVASGLVKMQEDSYICRNYTECSGGGVFIKESGIFFMYGGVIGWNRSNFGGGILCEGRLEIYGKSRICYNKVSTQRVQGFCGRGAGIALNRKTSNAQTLIKDYTKIFGNLAVRGANSSTNTDALGAGIYSSGPLTIKGGEIQIYDNDTDSDGAAIGIEGGTATLSGCKIYSNSAGRNGGAIFIKTINQTAEAKLTIKENVSIDLNSADTNKDGVGDGGAIYATTDTINASGKCSYVYIGEDGNTENIVITGNNANRGGAFYGADNARFVMNAGKVSENYSTGSNSGDGGGAMFIWGSQSNYSTFTMNGGVISGNRAKNGGAGGAVHIDHGSGGKAAFIMKGGLLSRNKATDENGNGSKLGGAIYVKNGGQIKLGGSAVIAVSEESDSCNDIYLGINEKTSVQQKITITGELTPGNNAAAGNQKYTARITPQTYTVGKELFQSDTYTITSDDYGKFCVTGNDDSDEWFITSAGNLSKPAAISDFSNVPDFNKYPRLTVSDNTEINKLAELVNVGNNMKGVTITLQNDVTLDSMIGSSGKEFHGTFDGNGKTITSNSNSGLMSIFYSVNGGGIVKNLTSEGTFICSGIVNNLYSSTVENCINNAEIINNKYSRCAGIVGWMSGGNIKNCINNGNISNTSASGTYVGGICGKDVNGGLILNCMNHGDIETSLKGENCIGGIVGTYQANSNKEGVFNCVNLGNIKVSGTYNAITSNAGGILGYANNYDFYITIKNCVSTGDILKDIDMTKGSIIGGCNSTEFNNLKCIYISETYCFKDTAFSGIGQNMTNVKMNFFTNNNDVFTTTEELTVGNTTSNNLIDLLNAWVDKENLTGATQYLRWAIVDGNPALSY